MEYSAILPFAVPGAAHWQYVRALKNAGISHIIAVERPAPAPKAGGAFAAAMRPAIDGYHPIPAAKNTGVGTAVQTALAYYTTHRAQLQTGGVVIDCFATLSPCGLADLCRESARRPDAVVFAALARGGQFFSAAMRVLSSQPMPKLDVHAAAIPNALVGKCMAATGASSSFMVSLAVLCARGGVKIATAPAQPMPKPQRRGLPRRPIADRFLYFYALTSSLLRFVANAAISGGLDFAVYTLMARLVLIALPDTVRLFLSALFARITSSTVNYALNRRLPFVTNSRLAPTILKYYSLWAVQLLLSFLCVFALHSLGVSELAAKIGVDICLGFFSYQIQMRWVFRQKQAPATDVSFKQEG